MLTLLLTNKLYHGQQLRIWISQMQESQAASQTTMQKEDVITMLKGMGYNWVSKSLCQEEKWLSSSQLH